MKRITPEKLKELFIQFIKKNDIELYNKYSESQLKLAGAYQFKVLREQIKEGTLKNFRLGFFGHFVVYPFRVESLKKDLEKKWAKKQITLEQYSYYKNVMNNYVNTLKRFMK